MAEANRSQYQLFLDRKDLVVEDQDEDLRACVRVGYHQIALNQGHHVLFRTYAHLGPKWIRTHCPIPDAGCLGDVEKIHETTCAERRSGELTRRWCRREASSKTRMLACPMRCEVDCSHDTNDLDS